MDEEQVGAVRQFASADQAVSWIADTCPPLWRRLYTGCIEEGFSSSEAFELLKTYIISQGTGGGK